jgi:hypothetical protein
LGKARKHIADNTPKGLTPLKPADVKFITNVIKVRVVEFTLELECDEPRYTVRDLLSAGKVLPADVTKQLQAAGLSARYLGQKYSKGEALPPIRDTFSIRADGSFGAVRALTPEKLGVLRSELPELPVEGEEKHLAAQGAAASWISRSGVAVPMLPPTAIRRGPRSMVPAGRVAPPR